MPRLIEHIDTIAYKKRRAVLYPEIHSQPFSETRAPVLDWRNAHGVPWVGCVPFAIPHVTATYLGQVYIDVPYEVSLPENRAQHDPLERPDETMRHAGVRFHAMPLDHALQNVDHDEPGFWQHWAEDF